MSVVVTNLARNDRVTADLDGRPVFGPTVAKRSQISFVVTPIREPETTITVRIVRAKRQPIVVARTVRVLAEGAEPQAATAGGTAPSTTRVVATAKLDTSAMSLGTWLAMGTWVELPYLPMGNRAVADYLTPDGNRIVTCGYFGEVQVRDLRTGHTSTFVDSLPSPGNSVKFNCPLRFTNNPSLVVLNARDWPGFSKPTAVLYDEQRQTYSPLPSEAQQVSGDGSTTIVTIGGKPYWFRLPADQRPAIEGVPPIPSNQSGPEVLGLSNSGNALLFKYIVSGSATIQYFVRNMTTGTNAPVGESIVGDANQYRPVSLSGDGETVLWVSLEGINFVDVKTGAIRATVKGFDGIVSARVNFGGARALVQDRQGLHYVMPNGIRIALVTNNFTSGRFDVSDDFITIRVPGPAVGFPASSIGVFRFPPIHDARMQ